MLVQYFGGKSTLAKKLIPILNHAPHYVYGLPFGGSAQSLWFKDRVRIEYYNDKDNRVVNMLTVVRERPGELKALLGLTPYSKHEFGQCKEISPDPVEDARRTFVLLNQGSNGRLSDPHWHNPSYINPHQGSRPQYFRNKQNDIMTAARRLCKVTITNGSAMELIEMLNYSGVLLYLDPPYLPEKRTPVKYSHDMTREEHMVMLKAIKDHNAYIVLSGYDNDLYNGILGHWYKVDLGETATRGSVNGEATKKKECLWLNYAPPKSVQLKLI